MRKLDKLTATRENNVHMDLLNSSGVTKNLEETFAGLILDTKRKI